MNIVIYIQIPTPKGSPNTKDYRVFLTDSSTNKLVSFWHDIPCLSSTNQHQEFFHYINEIPFNTTAKFEINTFEHLNPVKQDVKNNSLRYFRYGQIGFNYGALAQTWESPFDKHTATGFVGDNDPVDCVEISHFMTKVGQMRSNAELKVGQVLKVKILGCLALIDEDETDWKLIVINENSELFEKLNDIYDINRVCGTQLLESVKDWFVNYKTAEGKGVNKLGLDGEIANAKFGFMIAHEAHSAYQKLIRIVQARQMSVEDFMKTPKAQRREMWALSH